MYSHRLGRVFGGNTGFIIPQTGKLFPADVAFISLERLPVNTRYAVPVVPDLAVEIFSKTDDLFSIEDNVLFNLRSGVNSVWVVRPVTQTIEVYQAGQPTKFLTGSDELDGGAVLPGFKLKVSDIFDEVIGGIQPLDGNE